MGGYSISQIIESDKASSGYLCPNAACRRVFAAPLKATVLQEKSAETFDACPYCLTVITPNCAQSTQNVESVEEKAAEEEQVESAPLGNVSCHNHFGYLSERAVKAQIPDECLTCKDIIQCMLKRTLE